MNDATANNETSHGDDTAYRIFAVLAGIIGCAAVILGALGAHLFREQLEQSGGTENYQLAKTYLMVHALALAGVSLQGRLLPSRWTLLAGCCFLLGMLAFPGSLLVVSLTEWQTAANAAPVGGISLMAGWLLWGVAGWTARTGR